jgi:hypothetical protein
VFIIDLDLSSSIYNIHVYCSREHVCLYMPDIYRQCQKRLCYITHNEYISVAENGIYDINTGRYFASHHFNAMVGLCVINIISIYTLLFRNGCVAIVL